MEKQGTNYSNIPLITGIVSIFVVPLALAYNVSFFFGFSNQNFIVTKALLSLLSLGDHTQSVIFLIAFLSFAYPIYLLITGFYLVQLKSGILNAWHPKKEYALEIKELDRKKFKLLYGESLAGTLFKKQYEQPYRLNKAMGVLVLSSILALPAFLLNNHLLFILTTANSWFVFFAFILLDLVKNTSKIGWVIIIVPPIFIVLVGLGYIEGQSIRSGKSSLLIEKNSCTFLRSVESHFLCFEKDEQIVLICNKEVQCADFLNLAKADSAEWLSSFRRIELTIPRQ